MVAVERWDRFDLGPVTPRLCVSSSRQLCLHLDVYIYVGASLASYGFGVKKRQNAESIDLGSAAIRTGGGEERG